MIKEEIKKFFGGDEYIELSSLSKTSGYSQEYLLNIASRGKLKAFKMGDEWLTTHEWFGEYQKKIKEKITSEISDHHDNSAWVRVYQSKKRRFKILLPHAVAVVAFVCFVSWLVFFSSGNNFALSVGGKIENKNHVGSKISYQIQKTSDLIIDSGKDSVDSSANVVKSSGESVAFVSNNVFDLASSSYDVASAVGGSIAFIGDSAFGLANSSYDGVALIADTAVYIASSLDQKTSGYKFSDDVVTDYLSGIIELVKNNYQQVAGAHDVKKQIYYEEWQKSSGR